MTIVSIQGEEEEVKEVHYKYLDVHLYERPDWVPEKRTLSMLVSLLNNVSHPLHDMLVEKTWHFYGVDQLETLPV